MITNLPFSISIVLVSSQHSFTKVIEDKALLHICVTLKNHLMLQA